MEKQNYRWYLLAKPQHLSLYQSIRLCCVLYSCHFPPSYGGEEAIHCWIPKNHPGNDSWFPDPASSLPHPTFMMIDRLPRQAFSAPGQLTDRSLQNRLTGAFDNAAIVASIVVDNESRGGKKRTCPFTDFLKRLVRLFKK